MLAPRKSFTLIFSAPCLTALLFSATALAEDLVRLGKGSLSIALDPNYGGRITELRLGDKDLLELPEPGGNNFGSTFWLSPQSLWNWPPVEAHDSAPYRISEQGEHRVSLAGEYAAGARVHKTVIVNGANSARVQYRIDAEKDFPEIAAWEITRVPNRGLAFAPVTTDTVKTVRGQMAYQLEDDILWLPMAANAPLVEGKVIANGTEGWLAYAVDGLLYLKVYPKVAPGEMATGEGDIELYLSGEKPYLELEVQSAARNLLTGEVLDWTVDWLVHPIPDDIELRPGSAALLEFTRQQIELASRP
ncbi:DUF4380 domain-containing protein [Microbulbifer bruguierae]|uniref:DUF4380 domain-containing protein n=1 Tax=Microbulbifer bruguierae TaxID=3029061 RepID=A0ABY8NJ56_9GAMM|nr:DUF4380 domain-containing protein [Microbulbifer bruguierae]WGL17628.1 DUF4380 domain-containing protein [Microbulbifer bruguierae]